MIIIMTEKNSRLGRDTTCEKLTCLNVSQLQTKLLWFTSTVRKRTHCVQQSVEAGNILMNPPWHGCMPSWCNVAYKLIPVAGSPDTESLLLRAGRKDKDPPSQLPWASTADSTDTNYSEALRWTKEQKQWSQAWAQRGRGGGKTGAKIASELRWVRGGKRTEWKILPLKSRQEQTELTEAFAAVWRDVRYKENQMASVASYGEMAEIRTIQYIPVQTAPRYGLSCFILTRCYDKATTYSTCYR